MCDATWDHTKCALCAYRVREYAKCGMDVAMRAGSAVLRTQNIDFREDGWELRVVREICFISKSEFTPV